MIIRNSSTLFTASTESGGQVQANKGLKEKGANCIFSRGNTNSCGETLVREGISDAGLPSGRNTERGTRVPRACRIRLGVASNESRNSSRAGGGRPAVPRTSRILFGVASNQSPIPPREGSAVRDSLYLMASRGFPVRRSHHNAVG